MLRIKHHLEQINYFWKYYIILKIGAILLPQKVIVESKKKNLLT